MDKCSRCKAEIHIQAHNFMAAGATFVATIEDYALIRVDRWGLNPDGIEDAPAICLKCVGTLKAWLRGSE